MPRFSADASRGLEGLDDIVDLGPGRGSMITVVGPTGAGQMEILLHLISTVAGAGGQAPLMICDDQLGLRHAKAVADGRFEIALIEPGPGVFGAIASQAQAFSSEVIAVDLGPRALEAARVSGGDPLELSRSLVRMEKTCVFTIERGSGEWPRWFRAMRFYSTQCIELLLDGEAPCGGASTQVLARAVKGTARTADREVLLTLPT